MIRVIENQSLFDIAIQESGSVLAAFDLALTNGLSITDDLAPGQKLIASNSEFSNNEVANYFKGKNLMVATGYIIDDGEVILPKLGIGTMAIGSTFIVG
jgi:capsid protein